MKKSVLATSAILMLLLSGCSGSPASEQNGSHGSSTSSIQSSPTWSAASTSWTRVDKKLFWHNTQLFAHGNYSFPAIAFEYPSGWKFNCCGDMDHASEHIICPADAINDKSSSSVGNFRDTCGKDYVLITDYVLAGCPEGKSECSIDQQVSKTAQQKYDGLIRGLRAKTEVQILPADYASGLKKDAFVYENSEHVRSYLINLGDDVIEVAFTQSLVMKGDFVNEFLSRMTWDRE